MKNNFENFRRILKESKKLSPTNEDNGSVESPGGIMGAAGVFEEGNSVPDFEKQFEMGVEVEMEHTDEPLVAAGIALDHLQENPEYYTKLNKAELDEVSDNNSDGGGENNPPQKDARYGFHWKEMGGHYYHLNKDFPEKKLSKNSTMSQKTLDKHGLSYDSPPEEKTVNEIELRPDTKYFTDRPQKPEFTGDITHHIKGPEESPTHNGDPFVYNKIEKIFQKLRNQEDDEKGLEEENKQDSDYWSKHKRIDKRNVFGKTRDEIGQDGRNLYKLTELFKRYTKRQVSEALNNLTNNYNQPESRIDLKKLRDIILSLKQNRNYNTEVPDNLLSTTMAAVNLENKETYKKNPDGSVKTDGLGRYGTHVLGKIHTGQGFKNKTPMKVRWQ